MKGLLRALKGIIAGYVDCNRLELRDGLSNDAEEGTGGALTFTETPNCTDRLEPRFRDVSVVGNRALKGSLSAKKVSENLEKVPRIWEGEGSRRSEIMNPINNDYWVMNRPPYQILPRTNNYFHCLCNFPDLLQ